MTVTTDFEANRMAYASEDFDSEAIESVGYNRENKELYVEFQSGGEYVYKGVEESTYEAFVKSDSLGNFWRNYISPKYTSEKFLGVCFDESDREDAVQPTQKWLTGDDEPAIETEASDENLFVVTDELTRLLGLSPSRYAVEYVVEGDGAVSLPAGPFRPEFQANTEDDALAQFTTAFESMRALTGLDITFKVRSVTRYLD